MSYIGMNLQHLFHSCFYGRRTTDYQILLPVILCCVCKKQLQQQP